MGEMEIAIAQIFRKKGKSSMAEKDFVFAVSLDFRWFGPKEAQKLLELGLDSGLLELADGMVSPTFDHKAVEVPKGFRPSADLLTGQIQPKPKGLFLKIVDAVAAKTGMPAKDLISQINQTQDRMGVDVEVAALIVAKNLGVDIQEYLDPVEEEIGTRYRKN